ncbi:MAG TPA: hypothetical protein VH815_11000 [Acidobacteriota bacterium]
MRKNFLIKRRSHPWRDFAFGLVGGLAGTVAMDYYWKGVVKITGADPRKMTADETPQVLDDISIGKKKFREGENATSVIGREAYTAIKGEEPPQKTKKSLGNLIHLIYGTVQGGIYSIYKNKTGLSEIPASLTYGTGLWAIGSELGVPMLGLAKGPTAFPVQHHVYSMVAHWVYGSTVGCVEKTLNWIIER